VRIAAIRRIEGVLTPIAITQCVVNVNPMSASPYRVLTLTFTNQKNVAADDARFTIAYAGQIVHVRDAGTFSNNVPIHADFKAFSGTNYRGSAPQACSLDYAHFADGTTWNSGTIGTTP
jgi:hypothetical protein